MQARKVASIYFLTDWKLLAELYAPFRVLQSDAPPSTHVYSFVRSLGDEDHGGEIREG